MKRTHAHSLAQFSQRHHALGFVEQLAGTRHRLRLRGDLRRLAPQARTIARPFSQLRIGEKLHRIPPRTPARARRPAVNSGGTYGEDEPAVLPRVPFHHLSPLRFGLHVAKVALLISRRYPGLAGKLNSCTWDFTTAGGRRPSSANGHAEGLLVSWAFRTHSCRTSGLTSIYAEMSWLLRRAFSMSRSLVSRSV